MSDTPKGGSTSGSERRTALPVVGQPAPERGVQGVGDGGDPRALARTHVRARIEGLDRREALKLMAAAAVLPALAGCEPLPEADDAGAGGAGSAAGSDAGAGAAAPPPSGANPLARGDAWDPDLLNPTVRWEGVLSDDELATLAVLCDLIIPADDRSPSASSVGAPAYIDEWVSAPYDGYRRDQVLVRGGLVWLDSESARRFEGGRRFRDLSSEQQHAICDDICDPARARPEHRQAARFFARVRDLTAGAFYTTDEGMADIGYVGNVPVHGDWPAPPAEAFRHLGMEAP